MTLQRAVFAVLEPDGDGTPLGRIVDVFLVALILANITAFVAESVPEVRAAYGPSLAAFEVSSLIVFALEYATRLWACTTDARYAHPLWGRLRYACRPLLLVDLLAVAPALLALAAADLRVLRTLRLLRLLRLFKLSRHSQSLRMFERVLMSRAPELLSTMFVMLVLLVLASSLMYHLEHEANPGFSSIPAAMWWGIATFTTVGYGDLTPITPAGKVLGGAVALLGIAMFAIPAGVLGAAFSDELQEQRRKRDQSPRS